ncbi:McrB family protein [Kocuria sp. NPDC057446]|uniref:McrB family protein n=1 Tax=Kocuria sp. NPDC057446 TaxID=3346137 RepID=UPI0036A5E180
MAESDDATTSRSRVTLPSAQKMYWAARQWRDRSLIDDRSLFSGEFINGKAAVQELVDGFILRPDLGEGTFYGKLEAQLADLSADAVQLAAELMYVYYLIVTTRAARAKTKRDQIRMILDYRNAGTSDLPDEFAEALAGGVAHPGTGYNTYRWKMFAYLIRVYEAAKTLPPAERTGVFTDWDTFQRFMERIDDQSVWSQRFALEHMLFPDYAPAITSRDDRRALPKFFAERLGGEYEVAEIVRRLEPNAWFGNRAYTDLYRTPYRELWQQPNPKMETYVSWARRFTNVLDQPRAVWEERALRAEGALRAATSGGPIGGPLRAALADLDSGLASAVSTVVSWAQSDDAAARHALIAFADHRGGEAIDQFWNRVPDNVRPGDRAQMALASVLLMAQDAEGFPLWPFETAATSHRLANGYPGQDSSTVGENYVLYLERLDAARVGLGSPEDLWGTRLDAAVLADLLVRTGRPEGWEDTEWRAYDAWRTGKTVALTAANTTSSTAAAVVTAPAEGPGMEAPSSGSFEDLADALSLDEDGAKWLEETLELLQLKKQLILQGPPGTGKTHLARKLAEFLAGAPERVTLTQFHPGTSYEDFVQGLRPDPENPTSFRVVDGPLLRLAKEAVAHPEDTYVMLVDEINRGNVPAVFGELYYLLEYRGEAVTLTYGQDFSLPGNLFLLGTMNTADRSITALDSALRRRFYVRDLRPGETPVDGMLRNHLAQHDAELEWLAELLDRANGIIKDKDQHVGPSHFMGQQMDETRARRAWDYTVMPTLREVFYRRPELLDQLEFATLKAAVTHTAGDAAAD